MTGAGASADALAQYYAARAAEYEAIYAKPERQADLARLRAAVAAFAAGRHVLEVACGTGFWTQALAATAASVTATDVGVEVLAVARAKALPATVTLRVADAFALDGVDGRFDAAFVGFWWSHVPRADLGRFLEGLGRRLERGARVLAIDNRYVAGSSTPVSRTDEAGDTWQLRRLADGSTHEVRKNFPTADEVRGRLAAAGAVRVDVRETDYFWLASYEVAG